MYDKCTVVVKGHVIIECFGQTPGGSNKTRSTKVNLLHSQDMEYCGQPESIDGTAVGIPAVNNDSWCWKKLSHAKRQLN